LRKVNSERERERGNREKMLDVWGYVVRGTDIVKRKNDRQSDEREREKKYI
jgi:hypothetical protein